MSSAPKRRGNLSDLGVIICPIGFNVRELSAQAADRDLLDVKHAKWIRREMLQGVLARMERQRDKCLEAAGLILQWPQRLSR